MIVEWKFCPWKQNWVPCRNGEREYPHIFGTEVEPGTNNRVNFVFFRIMVQSANPSNYTLQSRNI